MKSLRTRTHKAFITALKAARLEAGLTQQQLADRIKRPQSFIAAIEAGDRRLDVPEFLQVAAALKIDPCAILRKIR